MSERNALELTESPGIRFDHLFEANYNAIYRYCARRLGRSDAEDAAAEVFTVAWRRLDDMPDGDAMRAWLFGVAHRVVGGQYRSRERRSRLAVRLEQASDSNPVDFEPPGDIDALLTALHGLSRTDQELLRLSSWDGLTRNEIAQVLGIKENAVDQRLHRARNRLKVRFDRLSNEAASLSHKEAPA
ncbi:MAG TPA: sigma-70 family RNA polymerase sigma factor [Acidimicrobiia bacterium]|nr:sigma-70 family RNA polymerase sigma factor [Acidimicrobiia bacterium]